MFDRFSLRARGAGFSCSSAADVSTIVSPSSFFFRGAFFFAGLGVSTIASANSFSTTVSVSVSGSGSDSDSVPVPVSDSVSVVRDDDGCVVLVLTHLRKRGDSLLLALLAFEIARGLPCLRDAARAARRSRCASRAEPSDPVHERDERKRGAADQKKTDAREADEKRSDGREERARDLAEELAHRARRDVTFERGPPCPSDLHERRRDDRHEQIARDARWRHERIAMTHERNSEQRELERNRPRDDADEINQRARARLTDRPDPIRSGADTTPATAR